MVKIKCADSLHDTRSAEPDWETDLGAGTIDPGGHVCPACDRLQDSDSVSNPDDGRNIWVVYFNGDMTLTVDRRYPNGTAVSTKTKSGKLRDVFTAAQITAMKDKLKTWFKA